MAKALEKVVISERMPPQYTAPIKTDTAALQEYAASGVQEKEK